MSAKHPFRNRYAEPGYKWWFAMPDGKWAWLRWVTRRWLGDYYHG